MPAQQVPNAEGAPARSAPNKLRTNTSLSKLMIMRASNKAEPRHAARGAKLNAAPRRSFKISLIFLFLVTFTKLSGVLAPPTQTGNSSNTTVSTIQTAPQLEPLRNLIFIDQLLQAAVAANKTAKSPAKLPTNSSIISAFTRVEPLKAPANLTTSRPLRVQSTVPQQVRANSSSTNLAAVRQRWRMMERALGGRLSARTTELRQLLAEPSASSLSASCRWALDEWLAALDEQQLWAAQLLDASAPTPAGLLEGTLTELGAFDQCLRAWGQPEGGAPIRGQYCSVQVRPHLVQRPRLHTVCQRAPAALSAAANQSSWRALSANSHHFYYAGLRLGVCLPSQCARADLQLLLSAHLAKLELLGQVKSCQQQQQQQQAATSANNGANQEGADVSGYFLTATANLDLTQQCIASTFVALLLLSLLGTLLDTKQAPLGIQAATTTTTTTTQADSQAKLRAPSNRKGAPLPPPPPPRRVGNQLSDSSSQPSAKRWQYQVYQDSSALSDSTEGRLSFSCSTGGSLAAQQNPIAEQNLLALCGAKKSSAKAGHELLFVAVPNQAAQLASKVQALLSPGGCGVELAQQPLTRATSDDDDGGGAAWRRVPASLAARNRKHGRHQPLPAPKATPNSTAEFLRGLLVCFSLKKNLRAIGRHKGGARGEAEQQMDDIKVIHGLRTLAMVWIIFGHTIGLVNPEMMNNLFALAQLSCSSRFLQALLNATLAVNTFFMISGLVTVVSFVRKCKSARLHLEQGSSEASAAPPHGRRRRRQASDSSSLDSSQCGSSLASSSSQSASSHRRLGPERNAKRPSGWPADFRPLVWLLLRYLRLTPAYAAVVAISVLLPALGSGPFWPELVGAQGAACRAAWWTNLLYVNNFVNTDKLCLIHSWYLSNDWHFFALALLLMALFYKLKRAALLAIVLLLAFGSSAATFALTVANNFPPTIVTTSPAVAERWLFIYSLYYKPWPHLSSYLVGLITGYLLVARKSPEPTAKRRVWRALGWLIWALVSVSLLNSVYPWNMGLQVEPLLAGLHSATFRPLWACCCAWLVFALATRPNSNLARFFAWHGFQLTSRLTYCAYLVHPLLIYYHFGTLRERIDSSPYGQLHRFVATLGLSYLFALLLALLVESPSIQLQRFLLSWPQGGASGRSNSSTSQAKTHTSESSTKNSWSATSSFTDPPPGGASGQPRSVNQAGGVRLSARAGAVKLLDGRRQDDCCAHKAPKATPFELAASSTVKEAAASSQQPSSESADESSMAAADAEFQKRLAQAISRGFRLRSRLANAAGTPPPVSGPQAGRHAHQPDRVAPEACGRNSNADQNNSSSSGSGSGSGSNNNTSGYGCSAGACGVGGDGGAGARRGSRARKAKGEALSTFFVAPPDAQRRHSQDLTTTAAGELAQCSARFNCGLSRSQCRAEGCGTGGALCGRE